MHRGRERVGTQVGEWLNPTTDPTPDIIPYQRPTDWLSLPDIPLGTQKIYILHAVFDCDTNFVSFTCQDAYTVDWGDGSAPENFAWNTQASHVFDYDDFPGTECSRGYRQAIITITPQGGGNLVYAIFDKKHPSAGYYCTTGILYVKMRSAEFLYFHFFWDGQAPSDMLEEFEFLGTSKLVYFWNMFQNCYSLVKCKIDLGNTLTFGNSMFANCYSLREVSLTGTSALTTMASMFAYCYSLKIAPDMDTSNVTTMTSAFVFCSNLESVPAYNTVNVTVFSNMFNGCSKLRRVPSFDISKATTLEAMFYNCKSLQAAPSLTFPTTVATTKNMFCNCFNIKTVPLYDLSHVTNASDMFSNCSSLKIVPNFDLSSATDLSNMFVACISMSEVGDLKTPIATNMWGMFYLCFSLRSIVGIDTSNATNTSFMFAECYNLKSILILNLSKVTDASYMFANCYVLQSVPLFVMNTTGSMDVSYMFYACRTLNNIAFINGSKFLTSVLSMFALCYSLRIAAIDDLTITSGQSFSLASCNLARAELVDIFNGLHDYAGGGGTYTLVITGNWGAASLSAAELLVGTNRGWSIVI